MHGNLGADGGLAKILGAVAPQAPTGAILEVDIVGKGPFSLGEVFYSNWIIQE